MESPPDNPAIAVWVIVCLRLRLRPVEISQNPWLRKSQLRVSYITKWPNVPSRIHHSASWQIRVPYRPSWIHPFRCSLSRSRPMAYNLPGEPPLPPSGGPSFPSNGNSQIRYQHIHSHRPQTITSPEITAIGWRRCDRWN